MRSVGGGDYGSVKVRFRLSVPFPHVVRGRSIDAVRGLWDMGCLKKVSRAILLKGSGVAFVTGQKHDAEKP